MTLLNISGSRDDQHWPKLERLDQVEDFVVKNIEQDCEYAVSTTPTEDRVDIHSYIKIFQENCSVMKDTGPIPAASPGSKQLLSQQHISTASLRSLHALMQKDNMIVLEVGIDSLAHCFCDESPSTELLEAYNSFLVPTLIIAATLTGEEVTISTENTARGHAKNHLSEEGRRYFGRKLMLMRREGGGIEVVRMLKEGLISSCKSY